ncbi:MAG: 3-isopropylmalate dehydratase small subunit [Elusimicrobiota bacterium]|nr:3-isopropylmalate dehydratase small subunit [Elusimicrobiota bacterium]
MKVKGRIIKYRDNINTDVIIPAKYLNISNIKELAKHCFESIDEKFIEKVQTKKIIVAGRNFGCGSSREHAPKALKAAGVKCIVACSFARIFFRNAINIGLPVIESKEVVRDATNNDELEVDFTNGRIVNITKNRSYRIQYYPEFIQRIINSGGLISYLKMEDIREKRKWKQKKSIKLV